MKTGNHALLLSELILSWPSTNRQYFVNEKTVPRIVSPYWWTTKTTNRSKDFPFKPVAPWFLPLTQLFCAQHWLVDHSDIFRSYIRPLRLFASNWFYCQGFSRLSLFIVALYPTIIRTCLISSEHALWLVACLCKLVQVGFIACWSLLFISFCFYFYLIKMLSSTFLLHPPPTKKREIVVSWLSPCSPDSHAMPIQFLRVCSTSRALFTVLM